MQRTGSRPIGVIIAVIVIALCAYGAIQLASTTDNPNTGNTPTNQDVATNQPTSPANNERSNEPTPMPQPSQSDRTDGNNTPTPSSTEEQPARDATSDEADPTSRARGDESSEQLPSTGPVWMEVASTSLLAVLLSAYLRSRRQLSMLFIER